MPNEVPQTKAPEPKRVEEVKEAILVQKPLEHLEKQVVKGKEAENKTQTPKEAQVVKAKQAEEQPQAPKEAERLSEPQVKAEVKEPQKAEPKEQIKPETAGPSVRQAPAQQMVSRTDAITPASLNVDKSAACKCIIQ